MTLSTGPALLAPIIAHRGASADAPENTLAALSLAADHGAMCVEIDVSISADQIPFVHHDDRLERCTNGTGLLFEHSAAQLDLLDASKNHPNYAGEPLPRLSAVIDLLEARGLGLNLEIKPRKGLEADTVEAICSVIEQRWPSQLPLVFSSFCQRSLTLARDRLPQVPRGLLLGGIGEEWQTLLVKLACRNLHCSATDLSVEQVTQLLRANVGVYCYTVNEPQRAAELLDAGVHGIFTDHPKLMTDYLEI